MDQFKSDGRYKDDLNEYADLILNRYGTASKTAEREILYLAETGNTVAKNAYADLLFYKRILRRDPFLDAFHMYLDAADIHIDEEGEWHCSGSSYPVAFWSIGLFLTNYRRHSFLKECEEVPEIEAMSLAKRLGMALRLAIATSDYVESPGAINLVGRILYESTLQEDVFEEMRGGIAETLTSRWEEIAASSHSYRSKEDCIRGAEAFFRMAAAEGYVYACNNLAIQEGEKIIQLKKKGAEPEEIEDHIQLYIDYLSRSADKYEPYAANRLGMFYVEGEVKGTSETIQFREHIIPSLAKEYFRKATVYPDENSAWAFLNLISHFHSDYTHNLELLDEHMGYIEQLNPEVYDIAMEI